MPNGIQNLVNPKNLTKIVVQDKIILNHKNQINQSSDKKISTQITQIKQIFADNKNLCESAASVLTAVQNT